MLVSPTTDRTAAKQAIAGLTTGSVRPTAAVLSPWAASRGAPR